MHHSLDTAKISAPKRLLSFEIFIYFIKLRYHLQCSYQIYFREETRKHHHSPHLLIQREQNPRRLILPQRPYPHSHHQPLLGADGRPGGITSRARRSLRSHLHATHSILYVTYQTVRSSVYLFVYLVELALRQSHLLSKVVRVAWK